ncbi:MAG: hypothetical protein JRF28_08040 [Deltaproteobacteria bacterium]|nr:hypothetical protein [Deltaproteobacteria bacterium]
MRLRSFVLIGTLLVAFVPLYGCALKPVTTENILNTPEHHVLSGIKFLELGKYSEALREFELAKVLAPTYSKAYVGSGLVWGNKGNCKKGIEEIRKAQTLANTDEELAFAHVGLIRLYLTDKGTDFKNFFAEVESAYRAAIKLFPDSSEAHYYMGKIYQEASEFTIATGLFKSVIEINKTHVDEARQELDFIKVIQGK